MTKCTNDYTVHYRWEWFRREQWRQSFREMKKHSSRAFVELVRERKTLDKPVLDCSCGLGLKTIVMREGELNIHGSDGCAQAIELARLFAAEEGHPEIPYFASSWVELPLRTKTRYAGIFNDALCWTHSDEEMAASLRGIHDCLLPGGILTYMGASPGTDTDRQQFLEQEWKKKTTNGTHFLGMQAVVGNTSVQEVVFLEKGSDFIDEHHLYIVNNGATNHLENWCLRCSLKWSWPRIKPFLEEAGFSSFGTKALVTADGKSFHLVVAGRD